MTTDFDDSDPSATVFTVDELTSRIKRSLETLFVKVIVEGEISNFTRASSGHLYFTLKDEKAQIRAVMFRGSAETLTFEPANGMLVRAFGRITVYKPRGMYQISVSGLEEAGLGKLQAAFERLKKKLAEEGLFDIERKKEIPLFPEKIGIVTSPTGAAVRDILKVLRRRFPIPEVILFPVQVQGDEAAPAIVKAIDYFNEKKLADVLIVGRGGGSLEDLWAFNEEEVARAIYRSRIPVISGVGHEIDFTIADFTADRRAPTPSAAAEIAVPDMAELLSAIGMSETRISMNMRKKIDYLKTKVLSLVNDYRMRAPAESVRTHMQRVDEICRILDSSWKRIITEKYSGLENMEGRLTTLDPEAILQRGYSICREPSSHRVFTEVKQVKVGREIEVVMWGGELEALVKKRHLRDAGEGGPDSSMVSRETPIENSRLDKSEQGSLWNDG